MDQIGYKIHEISNAVLPKDKKNIDYDHTIDSKEMHRLLKDIEIHLDKLINFRRDYMNSADKNNQKILQEIEKRITEIDKQ